MTPQEVLAALESAPKVAVQRSSGWVAYSVGSFMVGFTHDEPIGKEEYLQQSGFLTIAAPQVEGHRWSTTSTKDGRSVRCRTSTALLATGPRGTSGCD